MNYYRITGYCPENDFCFIVDSNGMFDELWKFSSYLVKRGLNILEVSRLEKIIDLNIKQTPEDKGHIILQANANGKPEYMEKEINGIKYKAIKVGNKIYIPNKEERI